MDNSSIIQKISNALVTASSTFREDQVDAYRKAIEKETNPKSKWILSQILENAQVAQLRCGPMCDDTGIPHVFIELGKNKGLTGETIFSINEGIKEGLRLLPGRPMAVKGDDMCRLDQSQGLDMDPAALEMAPLIVKHIDEDILRATILMLGGGPAIRGITHRVFHKHSVDTVIDEIVARAQEAVSKLGCSPCTLAVGIGRSQYEATALMMEAMATGNYNIQSDFENEISERVNKANIGPLGLGGITSVLATFAKVGPQRASGVRIVALRPCCCFEPRRASVLL